MSERATMSGGAGDAPQRSAEHEPPHGRRSDHRSPDPDGAAPPTAADAHRFATQRRAVPVLSGAGSGDAEGSRRRGRTRWPPPAVATAPPMRRAGSRARFPNKYPANLHHEVIAEGLLHHEQPADLDRASWRRCVALWQRRVAALEQRPGVQCTFLFKNVRPRWPAPRSRTITARCSACPRCHRGCNSNSDHSRALPHCPWCATLSNRGRRAAAGVRVAGARGDRTRPTEAAARDLAVADPLRRRLPAHRPRFAGDRAATRCSRQSRAASGDRRSTCGCIGCRDNGSTGTSSASRAPAQMAGLELGGDMYINALPAVVSAARLRHGLVSP